MQPNVTQEHLVQMAMSRGVPHVPQAHMPMHMEHSPLATIVIRAHLRMTSAQRPANYAVLAQSMMRTHPLVVQIVRLGRFKITLGKPLA